MAAQLTPVATAGNEALIYTKEPFREVAAPRKIQSIRFGLQSSQEVVQSSEFHVFERNLYEMPQRAPLANGVLDRRLVRLPYFSTSLDLNFPPLKYNIQFM